MYGYKAPGHPPRIGQAEPLRRPWDLTGRRAAGKNAQADR